MKNIILSLFWEAVAGNTDYTPIEETSASQISLRSPCASKQVFLSKSLEAESVNSDGSLNWS